MLELPRHTFSSPDEEIAFLREQLAKRTREAPVSAEEVSSFEARAKETIDEYRSVSSKQVLKKEATLSSDRVSSIAAEAAGSGDKIEHVLQAVREHGIKNALAILDTMNDPHTSDEVHRMLIDEIRNGMAVADMKEGAPPWQVLHMSLF